MRRTVKKMVQFMRRFEVEACSRQDVVDSFGGAKKNMYQSALASLEQNPLTWKDSRIKFFVKADKLDGVSTKAMKPRPIQGRGPRFNIEYGRFIQPVEKALTYWKGCDRGVPRSRVFAKGLDEVGRAKLVLAKFENFNKPTVICADASAFDGSVQTLHLRSVHVIYRTLIQNPRFEELMKETLVNVGMTPTGLQYWVLGNRMSGDKDTSIGNSLITYIIVATIFRLQGVRKWDLLCDGDDALIFTETGDTTLSEFVRTGARLGFDYSGSYTVEGKDNLEDIEFCRSKMVLVSGEWRFVRIIHRALATFGVTHQYHSKGEYSRYLRGVAMSALSSNQGVPCLSVLANAVLQRLGVEGKVLFEHSTIYKWLHYGKSVEWYGNIPKLLGSIGFAPVEHSTRISFARAFGISIEEQLDYEKKITAIIDTIDFGDWDGVMDDAVVDGTLHLWLHPELEFCCL